MCLIFTLLFVHDCEAAGSTGGRVVLVIAGNTSIRDLARPERSHLIDLLNSGSGGLMNIRAGRMTKDVELPEKPGMEAGCLSLGAGAMATGGVEVRRARNATSSNARESFICRTGINPSAAQVLHTEISKIQKINTGASYHATPGELGSALRKAGIRTAVIGNSDLPGEPHREAVAVAMDADGLVDYGDVDSREFTEASPRAPYGILTNSKALLQLAEDALSKSRFVVIDFGDTFRADNYAELCTEARTDDLRQEAAARLDWFIFGLIGKLDFGKDTLILLSPSARVFNDIPDEHLAPIIIKGPGFAKGMLTSPSTRRQGVVTVGDVAPTVLRALGLKQPAGMMGRPISSTPHTHIAQTLLDLNLDSAGQAQRQVAMRGASVAQSVVVVLATLAALAGVMGGLRRLAAWGALIPAALPITMLIMPPLYSGGLAGSVAMLVVLTLGILGICALLLRGAARAFVWLCGIAAALLVVDMALGAPLTSESIAGYGLAEGARYYGIGNELMGTLLGAVLIGLGAAFAGGKIVPKARGLIAGALFALVFLTIGWPKLGANLGGAMAAVPAMVIVLLARRGWKPNARGLAMVAMVTVVVIGALFAADAMRGGASQSHVGRAVDSGMFNLLDVVQRKLALNFMLVSTSMWSRLLGLSLVGSGVLLWWGMSRSAGKLLTNEESAAALGTCFGIVGAFAFNDSGVVAAATCSVYLWTLFALRVLLNPA
ncbi:MAG: hypothetical protein M1133_13060 [Armatimonadetes bacterium]|nr:hypothetical protein [Armatimonadota bacterium]